MRYSKITQEAGKTHISQLELKSNENVSNRGVCLIGSGFIISESEAKQLGLGQTPGMEKHVRNYRNAQDLTGRSRNVLAIDLYGLSEQETLSKFPTLYQHVYETVKPERDHNNRLSRREKWWLFGETNPKLREFLDRLCRYIVTAVTAKLLYMMKLEIKKKAGNL